MRCWKLSHGEGIHGSQTLNMLDVATRIEERSCHGSGRVPNDVLEATSPLVLRGIASEWPMVRASNRSASGGADYLRGFYRDATVCAFVGGASAEGRVFYNEDLSGFNYESHMIPFDRVLDMLEQHAGDTEPPLIYVGSTTVDVCLPGFRRDNDVGFGEYSPLASIWVGNRTRIAPHYDLPDNVACSVAGRRRFVLFPPEQLENLYVGPIDFTPAGQAISLVDVRNPDFNRFPKFRRALKEARLAELEPGDAILIPSMWWHYVESLDSFNVLVNYWWRKSPAWMGPPVDVLMHALLTIRDLPEAQRRAWKGIFDKYVFNGDEEFVAHIPEHRRGVLSPLDERRARELRARLLNRLNR